MVGKRKYSGLPFGQQRVLIARGGAHDSSIEIACISAVSIWFREFGRLSAVYTWKIAFNLLSVPETIGYDLDVLCYDQVVGGGGLLSGPCRDLKNRYTLITKARHSVERVGYGVSAGRRESIKCSACDLGIEYLQRALLQN
ncbi:hypothetical protein [Sphingomonas sp. UYP23]